MRAKDAAKTANLPLVYSCSGCSSAAQLANHVALQLDRRGVAEMSCIAGIGGDVPYLLKIAKSGRRIIALDGCALACTRNCLSRHDIAPDSYHQLQEYGVKKRLHEDFDPVQAETVIARVVAGLKPQLTVVTNSSAKDIKGTKKLAACITLATKTCILPNIF